MIGYLAGSVYQIMVSYPIMITWIMVATMLYLLYKRAHRFRPQGTLRLFGTSAIMAVTIPASTWVAAWLLRRFVSPGSQPLIFILLAPVLIVFVFAIAVTLIQRYLGADAEAALAISWPIVIITYVVPLTIFGILSIYHIGWLTGAQQFP